MWKEINVMLCYANISSDKDFFRFYDIMQYVVLSLSNPGSYKGKPALHTI